MLPTEDLFVHCYTLIDDLILGAQVVIDPPGAEAGLQRHRGRHDRAGATPAQAAQ
jgi:hypothetical protein